MAVITLSGVISAGNLNTNFASASASVLTNYGVKKYHQWDADVVDLTTALAEGLRVTDFTAPDDLQLVTMGMSMWNPDATSRSASMTLTCIGEDESALTKYIPNGSLSVSVTGAAAAEFNATRTVQTNAVFLIKGLTYRLEFLRTDANAGVIDRAYGFLSFSHQRRYR